MDRSNDSNSSGVRLMYFSGCLRVNPLVAYLSWNRAYDSPTKATDSSTKVFCNEKLSILHGALDADDPRGVRALVDHAPQVLHPLPLFIVHTGIRIRA